MDEHNEKSRSSKNSRHQEKKSGGSQKICMSHINHNIKQKNMDVHKEESGCFESWIVLILFVWFIQNIQIFCEPPDFSLLDIRVFLLLFVLIFLCGPFWKPLDVFLMYVQIVLLTSRSYCCCNLCPGCFLGCFFNLKFFLFSGEFWHRFLLVNWVTSFGHIFIT